MQSARYFYSFFIDFGYCFTRYDGICLPASVVGNLAEFIRGRYSKITAPIPFDGNSILIYGQDNWKDLLVESMVICRRGIP